MQDAGRAGPASCPSRCPCQLGFLALPVVGGEGGSPALASPFPFPGSVGGCPGFGTLPPPAACPSGRQSGPAARFPCTRGVRAWEPVKYPTAHALASRLCALWGRHEGARGGRVVPGCGPPRVRHSPFPNRPSLGQAVRSRSPFSVGAGVAGVGTRHELHSACSCELALRAVRVARVRPGRGASCFGLGPLEFGALPPPAASPWGRGLGPTARFPRARGVRAWGPVTNPTARPLASWLCALWGGHKGARGGQCLLPGFGASGFGRSTSPSRLFMGQAAGARCLFSVDAGRRFSSDFNTVCLLCLSCCLLLV